MQPIPKPKRTPKSKRLPNPQKNSRIVDPAALKRAARDYCQLCDRWGCIQVHHIIYRSQGGGDVDENLIALCIDCHDDGHGKGKSKITTPKEVFYRAKEEDNGQIHGIE